MLLKYTEKCFTNIFAVLMKDPSRPEYSSELCTGSPRFCYNQKFAVCHNRWKLSNVNKIALSNIQLLRYQANKFYIDQSLSIITNPSLLFYSASDTILRVNIRTLWIILHYTCYRRSNYFTLETMSCVAGEHHSGEQWAVLLVSIIAVSNELRCWWAL